MRRLAALLAAALIPGVAACTPAPHPVLLPEIPADAVFLPVEQAEFTVEPAVRIGRDPDRIGGGAAAVSMTITYTGGGTIRSVDTVVWLPDAARQLRADPWETQLPRGRRSELRSGSTMGLGILIQFDDFSQRETVRQAFMGPIRLRIQWEGGIRYFEVPAGHWQVELTDAAVSLG